MKITTTLAIILLIFTALACADGGQECTTPAPLNPNGDSELALLMREMEQDALRMKQQLQDGERPEVLKKFAAIHTAEATEPEKAASEKYRVFADSYLQTLEALGKAEAADAPQLYHGLVESCMNCHRALCPGPMVRVKKLYLPQ